MILDNTPGTVGCMINIAVNQAAEDKSAAMLKNIIFTALMSAQLYTKTFM